MRKPMTISLICIGISIALLLWGFGTPPAQPAALVPHYVLCIENDTGSFLLQLRKGLQEAAGEQGVRLTTEILTGTRQAYAAGLAERGVGAVLLLLSDPLPMCQALEAEGIPSVVVNHSLRGQTCVGADDSQAGKDLLTRGLELSPGKVALLQDEGDPLSKARAEGAAALLKAQPRATALAWPQEAGDLREYTAIIGTTSAITRTLAGWKGGGLLPKDCLVLGMDTGDSRVQDLEEGVVTVMAFDDPYAMGYLAFAKAVQGAAGQGQPSLQTCSSTLVDLDNMYDIENVKLVFPLLQ